MDNIITPDTWDLDYYKPHDLLGKDPNARWANRAAATAANNLAKEFFSLTGKHVSVNLPHNFKNNGPLEGTRRGTRSPASNPGVKGSRHLHGDAFDFQIQDLSDDEKATFLDLAIKKYGFKGVGFYTPEQGGHLHLDFGRKRTWGVQPKWAEKAFKRVKGPTIPYEVETAILHAAERGNLDPQLLAAFAYAESSYRPTLRASTSTATGLFQMTDGNWRYLTERFGSKYPEIEHWDRLNPLHNALMMAESINQNAKELKSFLGRDPTPAELYGAHFLGPTGFKKFHTHGAAHPYDFAYLNHKAAAEANRSVFFHKDGTPKTYEEISRWMEIKANNAPGWTAKSPLKPVTFGKDGFTFKDDEGHWDIDDEGNVTYVANESPKEETPVETVEVQKQPELPREWFTTVEDERGPRGARPLTMLVPQGMGLSTQDRATITRARIEERERLIKEGSHARLLRDAIGSEWATSWYGADFKRIPVDPDFELTPEMLKSAREGVNKEYWPLFEQATSGAMLQSMREFALEQQEMNARLDAAGAKGLAYRIGAVLADPADIAAVLATDGLAAPLMAGRKLTKAGKALYYGLVGAAGNVAATGVHDLAGDPRITGPDYAVAAIAGFGLGAAAGPFMAHPYTRAEAERLTESAAAMVADIQREMAEGADNALGGSVGAAQAPDPLAHPFLADKFDIADDANVPYSAYSNIRWGARARVGSSPNPIARMAASLGEEAVGLVDRSGKRVEYNPISRSEEWRKLQSTWELNFLKTYRAAFDNWAKEQNLNWWQKRRMLGEFNRQVIDFVTEYDPTVAERFNPHVQSAGQAFRRSMAAQLDAQRNPGIVDGTERASVKGYENVPKDDQYAPRIRDDVAIREWTQRVGDEEIKRAIRAAIRDYVQDELDEVTIRKMAEGYWRALQKRAHGLNDDFEAAWLGFDDDRLRMILREDAELDDEAIEKIVSLRPKSKNPDAGKDPRARRRMRLNENFPIDLIDRNGNTVRFRVADLFIRDAMILHTLYTRGAAARVSMARWRLFDPDTGELLLDGVKSKADFELFIKRMNEKGADLVRQGKMTASRLARDEANVRFMYDYIMGQLDYTNSEAMEWLRTLAKFNYARLMGQVGFAQIPEATAAAATLGFKTALKHMPALRKAVNMDGRMVMQDGFAEELAAVVGIGQDDILLGLPTRLDDNLSASTRPTERGRLVDKAHGLAEGAARTVTKYSGMSLINRVLQTWTLKIVAQKVADIVSKPKLSQRDFNILGSLGIDTKTRTKKLLPNPDWKPSDWVETLKQHRIREQLSREQAKANMPEADRARYEELERKSKALVDADEKAAAKEPDLTGVKIVPEYDPRVHGADWIDRAYGVRQEKLKDIERAEEAYTFATTNKEVRLASRLMRERDDLLDQADLEMLDDYHLALDELADLTNGEVTDIKGARALIKDLRKTGDDPELIRRLKEIVLRVREMGEENVRLFDRIAARQAKLDAMPDEIKEAAENADLLANAVEKAKQALKEHDANVAALQKALLEASDTTRVERQLDDMAKEMDEILRRNGYKPIPPPKESVPRMVEVEGTMVDRIARQIRQFAERDNTDLGTLHRLNLEKWDDQEARWHFTNALQRATRRWVQENDVGMMGRFMHNDLVRLLFQFRTFMLGAWEKQLLHNVYMSGLTGIRKGDFDPEGTFRLFLYFTTATILAGLTYTLQERLRAIGRDDAEEYLSLRLAPHNLMKAAFSRTGFASILPMLYDSAPAHLFHGGPVFDFRTSAQPQDIWLGNPVYGLLADGTQLLQALNAMAYGNAPDQKEARAFARFMPFNNMMPILQTYNLLLGQHGLGLEEKRLQ